MNARIHDRYVTDAVQTASPARLLIQLFDRLLLDLHRASEAIVTDDPAGAHDQLVHAQDIITELHSTLRVDAWDGAAGLAQLYDFAHRELVAANIGKDAPRVSSVRELLVPIRDAFAEAAAIDDTASTSLSA